MTDRSGGDRIEYPVAFSRLLEADRGDDGVRDDPSRFRSRERPSHRPTDPVAIAAFFCAILLLAIVAVALGHWATFRTERGELGGRGLAKAAIVLGYAELALAVLFWIFYFAVLAPLLTLPR